MVGSYLIDAALAKGHLVRAFGRSVFTRLSTERERLELVKGYLFDEDDIAQALHGVDAVLSALGGAVDGADKTRSLGMKNIVAGMEKQGIKRIAAVGGMGLLDAGEGMMLHETPKFPAQFIPVSLEHWAAWQTLRRSSLAWVLACPPDILNEPADGNLSTACNVFPQGLAKVHAGDLANFLLDQLHSEEFLGCRVGMSRAV